MRSLLLSLLFISQVSFAEVLDRVYATVNDEMISLGDIQHYQKLLKKGALYEDLLFPNPESVQKAIKDRNYLIEKMISEKLLDSEAKKLGINVTDDRINKEIQAKGGEAELKVLLNREGLTIKDFKEFLRKSIARKEVIQFFVRSKINISDDDIMDFYVTMSKGSQSGQGFEFNLSHILFPYDSTSEREMAMDAAQAALKSLQQGQSFASLHSKYNPREKDDNFGVFSSGEMLPAIEGAVTNLRAGDTSPIVETPLGFHIFKLNSKRVVNNPDFERRKQQIFQILFAKNFNEQIEYWLGQKRRSAVVKVYGEKK